MVDKITTVPRARMGAASASWRASMCSGSTALSWCFLGLAG
jgi:hypothetical protein